MSVKLEMQTTSKEIMEALEKIVKQLEEQGIAKEEIEEKKDIIEEDIKQQIKSIQKQMCENIKDKVKNDSTMTLESEEILEDNSVVLTINL